MTYLDCLKHNLRSTTPGCPKCEEELRAEVAALRAENAELTVQRNAWQAEAENREHLGIQVDELRERLSAAEAKLPPFRVVVKIPPKNRAGRCALTCTFLQYPGQCFMGWCDGFEPSDDCPRGRKEETA